MAPKKKSTTCETILNEAQYLFLARGFAGTSVDDICRQAKITKGGFFHHFKTKESLAKQVLEKFCSHSREEMRQAGCCQDVSDPFDRVLALLDGIPSAMFKKNKHRGCLITTFIQELSDSHPEIQSLCLKGLNEWAALLKTDLKLAKEKYIPDSSIDIPSLANHCIAVIEGAQIMAKASADRHVFDESLKHLKQYLTLTFKIKQRRVS
ncbi:MAG: TetR/AcrR family transcriptional regulator [Candidatus Omnitrophica bacterium]|nr:TetR/AcrR family transcriptional regulator [Candidatus Omnitrophota bacterium]